MFLTTEDFSRITQALRIGDPDARRREICAGVTIATASGERMIACIHHLGRGGLRFSTSRPLAHGVRFGFEVLTPADSYVLFCEVVKCHLDDGAIFLNGSFLEQEKHSGDDPVWTTN